MPQSAMGFAKHKVAAAAVVAALAFLLVFPAAALRAEALQKLQIVTTTGPHDFLVELADSPDERAKGLMYRRSMAADRGMLFDFHQVVPVMMWMKNTYIPLDIVFIASDGRVVNVAQETQPLSLEPIRSSAPVTMVLELAGGTAARIGLAAGDRVDYGIFASN